MVISRPPGHVITPGSVMVVRNEGMPKKENPTQKGDLYIEFQVDFPQTLPKDVSQIPFFSSQISVFFFKKRNKLVLEYYRPSPQS